MMADYRIVPIAELDDRQALELARIHYAVMHSLLTDLGLPFLERYYQIVRRDDSILGFGAISEKGTLLGWVSGSSKPEQVNGRLREPVTWFALQMFRLLFARPQVFLQLVKSVFSSYNPAGMASEAIELTYIGVSADQAGKGLGSKLMECFVESSREAGYHSIVLSVETDNRPALALYEHNGFEIIHTFTEGRFRRHRMELKI